MQEKKDNKKKKQIVPPISKIETKVLQKTLKKTPKILKNWQQNKEIYSFITKLIRHASEH